MTATANRLGRSLFSVAIYALASLTGLVVVVYPLWRSAVGSGGGPEAGAGGSIAPLVLALIVGLSFAALALEAASSGIGARTVAALGVLVAINSVLRFVEVAIPGPGGFSPVFFLVIMTGYAFGARFGLLMGSLTMGVSAVVTGGVGPWLPYQMLAAGWVGLTAGWLPGAGAQAAPLTEVTTGGPGPLAGRRLDAEIALLAAFGGLWGFLYGLLLTPWMWSVIDPGAGSGSVVPRFLAFYVSTSLLWDALRAAGTTVLVLAAGRPVLNALRRVAVRLDVQTPPVDGGDTEPPQGSDRAAEQLGDSEAHPSAAAAQPRAPSADGPAADAQPDAPVHPYALLAWAAAVAALASATRNPLILLLAALAVAVVGAALPERRDQLVRVPLGRLSATIVALSAAYYALTVHVGGTVLLRLPARLPLIGGPVTAESIVLGAATGLSLATLLGAFVTAQRALTVRALVRLIPRAFGSLALVGAVALSYIPSVGDQVAAVREAQAVRGHRVTGPRSWAALALPMLVGALERSAQLAESMASRGLVIADETPIAGRVAFAAGLAVLLLGWLGAATGTMGAAPAAALAVGGVALSGGALLWLGRRAPYTDFRPQPTCPRDAAIAAVAWLPLLVTLVDDGAAAALAYSPMPELALPPLDPWLVLGVAGLAAPVLAVAGLATPALLTPRLRTRGAGAPAGRGEAAVDASIAARAVDASIAPSAADTTIATEAAAGVATPPLRQRAGSRTPEQPADVFFIGYGVRYPGASSPALNDIDLRLPAGGLTVVAGPSGSGKSTLLRSINGLVPHFTGGQTWGAVTVGGTRARHCGAGGAAADVGFVPGDPESSFVMDTVADEVAFALEHQAISRDEMRDRVSAALRRVGLAGLEDRPLRRLSGGERQRVAVAAALALEPRVLLLDEPTSQLDDECASDVLAAVADVSARGDVTVVLVEHRLDRVLPYASQLVYLPGNGGRPLAGAPADVLRAVDVPSAPLATPVEPGATLLALRDITFRYGDSAVLTDASMAVRAGEVVALTGRSGSGKSTVLRLAVGLLRPDTGEVTIAGRSIAGRDTAEICRAAGYLPQDPSALLFAESVRDELRVTLANHGLPSNETDEGALLVALGIEHLAKRYPRELSTGQRQRAALASVTVTDPPLLLLDEPTRGMDDAAIADLATLLHERAAAGRGVLVATHDRRLIRAAHRRLRLERGRIEPAQLRW